jgi:hypothetical protein
LFMIELVQVTAQYSNAVLLAVLPYVSDFGHRLHLPISIPVTPGQVLEFRCDPRKDQIGGAVILTNGFRFSFLEGHVSSYCCPKSYSSLQNPDLIPRFFGPIRLEEKDAIKVAQNAVKRLGYTLDLFHAEVAPQVTKPETIGSNRVARYRFQWLDPNWRGSPKMTGITPALLDVEVDASNGEIQMLSMSGPNLHRPSPKVDVVPPLVARRAPEKSGLSGGRKTASLSSSYSAAFLEAILPQLSDFAAKVELPLRLPITTNDVDLAQYRCRLLDGQPMAQLFLKNGDRFNYDHGRVAAYYAHDAYHKFPEAGKLQNYTGRVNMSTNQAIALCERAIRSLGYKAKLPAPFIGNITQIGNRQVTRYVFYWWKPAEQSNFATFEVDMEGKLIKSAFLDDPSLWSDSPRIDVPLLEEENRMRMPGQTSPGSFPAGNATP